MKNIDRFNEAFGHMEHRVMGRRLCKFTLRHRFWLEAMESPVVRGGETSLMDLELAARVCAIPFGDIDRKLPRMLERGPGLLGKLGYLGRGWRGNTRMEYLKFQAYMMDHGCPPATWDEMAKGMEDAEEGQEGGSLPGVLGLVTGLMRGACWEPETVWALSPGEAEWYLAGVFMHRGIDVGLKSAEDEAMEAKLKQRTEEKEQNAKDAEVSQSGIEVEEKAKRGGAEVAEGDAENELDREINEAAEG